MKQLPLHDREGTVIAHALVDDEDFERFGHLRWHKSHYGYVVHDAMQDGKRVVLYLHREIMGLKHCDGREIDHVDDNPLENRRSNLRIATKAQNKQNLTKLRPDNKSGYRGVSQRTGSERWTATVKVNGKQHHLGTYDDAAEASEVAAAFRAIHMPYSPDARMVA
jgi:hypothetical protein